MNLNVCNYYLLNWNTNCFLLFNLKTIVLNDNFNDFKGHLYMQLFTFF